MSDVEEEKDQHEPSNDRRALRCNYREWHSINDVTLEPHLTHFSTVNNTHTILNTHTYRSIDLDHTRTLDPPDTRSLLDQIGILRTELTPRMAPKDRTSEFHSTLASIKSRSALPASSSSSSKSKSEAKQPLIPKENGRNTPKGSAAGTKSEFGRMAGGIAKDINSTTLKLQKLAQRESTHSIQQIFCDLSIRGKYGIEGLER